MCNSGQLFKNRDKGNNQKAPNLKGNALLELADASTVEFDIAAWTRESERAGRWLALSIKLEGAPETPTSRAQLPPHGHGAPMPVT